MTTGEARIALLLTLMRQLQEVMRTENGLLREMRLARLQELLAEKAALAEAYERELRRWRQAPGAVAEIGPASRATLETAMREFQAAVRGNAERLLQSRRAVEDLVRVIGDSLHGGPPPRAYAGGTQPAADTGAGRVIPLAFDRRC